MSAGQPRLCYAQTEEQAAAIHGLLLQSGIEARIVRSEELTMLFDNRNGSTPMWGELLVAASDFARAQRIIRALQSSLPK